MYYSPILFSTIANLNLSEFSDCKIDMTYLNSLENVIIFSTHSMGYLIKLNIFLVEIKRPFVIVSAMEDTQLPLEIDTDFLNNVKTNIYFKHWFSINKTIPNNRQFTSIPYGLNFWTLTSRNYFGEQKQDYTTQNNTFVNISNNSEHFSKRLPLIYANFHHNYTDERHGGWRRKLINIIPSKIIYYEKNILQRNQSLYNMSKYSFVLSPFGHGFDCIRTFEALCVGCIVIMKKSFLDIIYEDLPILLVDEYSDINEQLLEDTLKLFSKKSFNYEKLKFSYWVDIVYEKLLNNHSQGHL